MREPANERMVIEAEAVHISELSLVCVGSLCQFMYVW